MAINAALEPEYNPRPGFEAKAMTDDVWTMRPHRLSIMLGAS